MKIILTIQSYFRRFLGTGYKPHPFPPRPPILVMVSSFIGAFIGIGICAAIHYHVPSIEEKDLAMLIGSFGATAVLIYGTIDSPLAQPRNVFFGHVISAFIGVCISKMFENAPPNSKWAACALSVAISIVVMQITRTVHPPGGASALIAVSGSKTLVDLGFMYVLIPVASGAALMLAIALISNNVLRSYPLYFWKPISGARAAVINAAAAVATVQTETDAAGMEQLKKDAAMIASAHSVLSPGPVSEDKAEYAAETDFDDAGSYQAAVEAAALAVNQFRSEHPHEGHPRHEEHHLETVKSDIPLNSISIGSEES